MPNPRRPIRLLMLAFGAVILAALLWALSTVLHGIVSLVHSVRELPEWAQTASMMLIVMVIVAAAWLGWRVWRPRRRKPGVLAPPGRAEVDARITRLREQHSDTTQLQAELEELDRRAASDELYVAVFGEISAGKSSLIHALAPLASPQSDVLGGTTRAVTHYNTRMSNGAELVLADVPGTHEVAGSARESIARDEALRAHVVLYLCAGDLTRDQDAELRWLRDFGKPLVLVLNKADQFDAGERDALQAALRERYQQITDARVIISAGGSESFERHLADGRREFVQRERVPDVKVLLQLLDRYAANGANAFESARNASVLTAVAAKAQSLELVTRERDAEALVNKYTRRAVVGAMAAVMPGSDLVIQAVLATALIRELAKLYGVAIRDLDVDAFLGQVTLTVRTSASIVLAVAGNAMKAFPGVGTLGGGVLHAIAYGLIFDSLGHAVAGTLRDQHALDSAQATASLAELLANAGTERLRRIAAYALNPGEQK